MPLAAVSQLALGVFCLPQQTLSKQQKPQCTLVGCLGLLSMGSQWAPVAWARAASSTNPLRPYSASKPGVQLGSPGSVLGVSGSELPEPKAC